MGFTRASDPPGATAKIGTTNDPVNVAAVVGLVLDYPNQPSSQTPRDDSAAQRSSVVRLPQRGGVVCEG